MLTEAAATLPALLLAQCSSQGAELQPLLVQLVAGGKCGGDAFSSPFLWHRASSCAKHSPRAPLAPLRAPRACRQQEESAGEQHRGGRFQCRAMGRNETPVATLSLVGLKGSLQDSLVLI